MRDISDLMIKVGELDVDEHIAGKSIYLIDVSDVLTIEQYNLVLRMTNIGDLSKLHTSLIMAEDYEALSFVEEEIQRRGYAINIAEHSITYTKQ